MIDTERLSKEKKIKNSIDEMQYYYDRIDGLKKTGNIYTCSCIFHMEKTPSLRIFPPHYKNPNGKIQEFSSFYCFGCGKGGDLIKFEELYSDLNNREEAIASLQKQYNIDFEDDDLLSDLKLSLQEQENVKSVEVETLSDINFMCSIMCRNYLKFVFNYYQDKFDDEFMAIQEIYSKLDEQLLDMTATEAHKLILLTKNSINLRKKKLTFVE